MAKQYSRREFIRRNSLTGLGVSLTPSLLANGLTTIPAKETNPVPAPAIFSASDTPAILGGKPLRTNEWPTWPMWNPETDEKRVLEVLRSGIWSRAGVTTEFEKKWAETVGAKRCLAVVNGTNALIAALVQLDIGGGDEVLVPPYTFIATVAAVLATGAMPVFVDVDPETFQMDPAKIEAKITPRTRAIMPVHILGLPADMTRIMPIAKKHNLLVVEDACQAWLAEIDHKKVGTFGHAGCFSFQNSKNIPMGEGGAIVSDDDAFMDRCYSYHNFGNPYGSVVGDVGAGTLMMGTKLRLAEYQAAIGLAQLPRLQEQTVLRNKNAKFLKAQISQIPGIVPYKLYPNVTQAAFHLFPFRYQKEAFKGLPRADFLKALNAEGIPCASGYAPLNKMPYLAHAFQTKNFRRMYAKEQLDIKKYNAQNECPQNDKLCNEEAVWFQQNMLLGSQSDMSEIAAAINKIYQNADKIKSLATK
ncbi:DegT/DnrJ/EryC1/StrS family aminotransferase [Nibrella saemangeumensis]|uniref:DegT/DnrJ/EryC1/StrS family aminotransferase n=1 Tax=Nibrella saemangeumensis TaxID=1084526 RepID=A0ABP8MUU7_9BACT